MKADGSPQDGLPAVVEAAGRAGGGGCPGSKDGIGMLAASGGPAGACSLETPDAGKRWTGCCCKAGNGSGSDAGGDGVGGGDGSADAATVMAVDTAITGSVSVAMAVTATGSPAARCCDAVSASLTGGIPSRAGTCEGGGSGVASGRASRGLAVRNAGSAVSVAVPVVLVLSGEAVATWISIGSLSLRAMSGAARLSPSSVPPRPVALLAALVLSPSASSPVSATTTMLFLSAGSLSTALFPRDGAAASMVSCDGIICSTGMAAGAHGTEVAFGDTSGGGWAILTVEAAAADKATSPATVAAECVNVCSEAALPSHGVVSDDATVTTADPSGDEMETITSTTSPALSAAPPASPPLLVAAMASVS